MDHPVGKPATGGRVFVLALFVGVHSLCSPVLGDEKWRLCLAAVRALHHGDPRLVTDEWPVDGAHGGFAGNHGTRAGTSYNDFFAGVTELRTFEELARERRSQGRSTHTMDLFGSAVFTSEPSAFDNLIGVRLQPLSPHLLPPGYDRLAHRRELTGNLLSGATWRLIDETMRERNIRGFDFMFLRPVGPWNILTRGMDTGPQARSTTFGVAYLMVQRAFRRLSTDGGSLYVEIDPQFGRTPEFRRWLALLTESGIQHRYSEGMRRIPAPPGQTGFGMAPEARLVLTRQGDQALPMLPD